MTSRPLTKTLPLHGAIGLGLIIVCWTLNWSLSGLRTHLLFFPLWLGYCLTVDALTRFRSGTSMLSRSPLAYAKLFLMSVPAWWLFELFNWRTRNWFYAGRESFSDIEYFAFASLCFSTVMPAVFGTAELVASFTWVKRIRPGLRISLKQSTLFAFFGPGLLMLVLVLARPLYFFPFVWLSVYFILDPLNVWMKNRSILGYIANGDWRPMLSLCMGCLICGFFWEMWNFYSYPKWVYHVPFVDFFPIFEMPLLGYGGYLPFSMELFALYQLMSGLLKRGKVDDFIIISHDRMKSSTDFP
ncbi:MAG: hypothetical protein GY864_04755 [Desulfobacterales bacterium]|nr:hypothetical protein [Desulfobacterales bacterium]